MTPTSGTGPPPPSSSLYTTHHPSPSSCQQSRYYTTHSFRPCAELFSSTTLTPAHHQRTELPPTLCGPSNQTATAWQQATPHLKAAAVVLPSSASNQQPPNGAMDIRQHSSTTTPNANSNIGSYTTAVPNSIEQREQDLCDCIAALLERQQLLLQHQQLKQQQPNFDLGNRNNFDLCDTELLHSVSSSISPDGSTESLFHCSSTASRESSSAERPDGASFLKSLSFVSDETASNQRNQITTTAAGLEKALNSLSYSELTRLTSSPSPKLPPPPPRYALSPKWSPREYGRYNIDAEARKALQTFPSFPARSSEVTEHPMLQYNGQRNLARHDDPAVYHSNRIMKMAGVQDLEGIQRPRHASAQFTLIVSVPPTTTRHDLLKAFKVFGNVVMPTIVCRRETRHPKKEWTATAGYAFVLFGSYKAVCLALDATTRGSVIIRGIAVKAARAHKDSFTTKLLAPQYSLDCAVTATGAAWSPIYPQSEFEREMPQPRQQLFGVQLQQQQQLYQMALGQYHPCLTVVDPLAVALGHQLRRFS